MISMLSLSEQALQVNILKGLSTALRLQQLNNAHKANINLIILDKASQVGGHILSGCVTNIQTLQKLVPSSTFPHTPVSSDKLAFLTHKHIISSSSFPPFSNKGLSIISLSETCRKLKFEYEKIGGQIQESTSVTDLIYENGKVGGVKVASPEGSLDITSKYVIVAEGSKGFLTDKCIQASSLKPKSPSLYALGIKEVWEIEKKDTCCLMDGAVIHTIGYPSKFGGGFIYRHNSLLHIGYMTGLHYTNPSTDPYFEFQLFKEHPYIRKLLENMKRLEYGARVLNEGGYFSIPQLSQPGLMLVGCCGNLLDVVKLKGVENSIKSGSLASECLFKAFTNSNIDASELYMKEIKDSKFYKDLQKYKNSALLSTKSRLLWGINAIIPSILSKFDLCKWSANNDCYDSKLKDHAIKYHKPNNKTTFSKEDSLIYSSLSTNKSKEPHLKCVNRVINAEGVSLLGGPEKNICPAGVYEYNSSGSLTINHHNCLHCKACSAKVIKLAEL